MEVSWGSGWDRPRVSRPARGQPNCKALYLHLEELDQIHLITVYGKDQKDDLSADDKRLYRRLVQVLKDRSRRPRGVNGHEGRT